MKILYLHQYFNTPRMAGGTRSFEMARRLVAAGHEVDLITAERSGEASGWFETEEAGIRVHWLPAPYSNSMSYGQRLRSFVTYALAAGPKAARLGGDVVFATSTPLTIAIPGLYASRRLRVPMVFEVRDLWPEMPIAIGALRNPAAKALARGMARLAYRSAARVVALSPGMKEGVLRYGVAPERVSVIPNASDLEMFAPNEEMGSSFRREHSWLGERPLVLYAGTLGRVNGVGYLARVAHAMYVLDPQVRFLVVGGGYEAESVRREARRLGVLGKNFFMLGEQPKEEVRRAFAAATISCSCFIDLPEMWHNSANKVFDTLASGTPLAINYRGWQAELLERSGAGLVLPVSDHHAAAAGLHEVLANGEWLARAGRNARALAVERFSRDVLAAQLESVLREACEDRSRSTSNGALESPAK